MKDSRTDSVMVLTFRAHPELAKVLDEIALEQGSTRSKVIVRLLNDSIVRRDAILRPDPPKKKRSAK